MAEIQSKDRQYTAGAMSSYGRKNAPLARVHTPIKGVRGGQTSGGYIVSFNATAFTSYGQDKAAVAESSAFAYTTALNSLLTSNSRQKSASAMQLLFLGCIHQPGGELSLDILDPPSESDDSEISEDDQQTVVKIHGLLRVIREGKKPTDFLPDLDEDVQFLSSAYRRTPHVCRSVSGKRIVWVAC